MEGEGVVGRRGYRREGRGKYASLMLHNAIWQRYLLKFAL